MRLRRAAFTLVALVALSGVVAGNGSSRPGDAVTLEGRLVLVHSDNFATGQSTSRYELQTANGLRALSMRSLSAMPRLGRAVVDGVLNRATNSILVNSLRTSSASSATTGLTGTKKVAVILFTFSDNATQPYTPAYARGAMFTNTNSAAAYYQESSWGKLTLTGDVFGWYSIPDASTACNEDQWAADADKAAQAAGVNLSAYDYRVYGFPRVSACPWSGIAWMPGTQSWLNGTALDGIGIAHEMGHNFGLAHAVSYDCTQGGVRVALSTSSNCVAGQYGDPFTVMGTGKAGLTNYARATLGWLPASGTLDVTTNGTYSLAALGPATTAPQAIRISRGDGTYLLLEFRRLYGIFDQVFYPSNATIDGVIVRVVPSYGTVAQTLLVDTTPATATFSDGALGVGRSVTDPVSGATITTASISSPAASVQISFGSGSSPTQPPPPTNLSANPVDSTDVRLGWAGSGGSVAAYKVYRDGTYIATSTSTSYTNAGLTPGTTYSYKVTALSTVGNESTASNIATTTTPTVPDTTAPSTPTGLKATEVDVNTIALTWSPSTDNVGVAGYRVYRGSTQIGVTGSTSFVDNGLKPNTSYTYYVKAADAAGNVSASSSGSSAKTTDFVAPSPPGTLTAAEVDVHRIALSWAASTDNVAVTGYKLYRNGKFLKTVTSTTYTDTSLAANTTYTYFVTARDYVGNESAATNTASAKTLDTTPPTAPVLYAKVSNVTDAYVYWSASSDNAAVAGYRVYRNGVLVATTSPGTRAFTDHPAPKGTNTYRVVAFDAAGNTTASNTVSLAF